jgi:Myb-like DNA-binding domain
MPVHRGDQWTPEEDRLLLELVQAGKSWVLISAKLKRPLRSVQDRNRYLKRQSGNQGAVYKTRMGIRVGMPMVDVTAPDGSRELWAVAAAHHQALEIVRKLVIPNSTCRLLERLPFTQMKNGMRFGEAWRVEP